MAAKVYNAPSNPFRRSIMMRASTPGAEKVAGGTAKATGATGAPALGELGNPAMHQTFSGQGSSVAQLGQMLWQNSTYGAEQKGLGEAMSTFTNKLNNGMPANQALMELLKEDGGKHFLSLSGAGVLDKLEQFQAFQQQAQNLANAGQQQTFDFGGNNKIFQVIGPDGKPHYMNSNAVAQQNADTRSLAVNMPKLVPGITGPTGGAVTQSPSGIQEVPGLKPTSTVNAEANREATANRQSLTLNKPHWDGTNNRWVYPPGPNGESPNIVPINEPTVKPSSQASGFFSVAPNLYGALKTMDDLVTATPERTGVTGPLTGKLRTLSGKVLGEDQAAQQWTTALGAAENAIAGMGRAGGGYVAGMKERISNLPKDWQSASQNKMIAQQTMRDLQQQVGTVAAGEEAKGLLPEEQANSLAKMGVFTKRFAPALQKMRTDPGTMTNDEVKSLAPYAQQMTAEDRQKLRDTVQQRMTTSAQQSAPTPDTDQ